MDKSGMVLSKVFSGQWLMAVGVTFGATLLTVLCVWKRPEHASTVLTVYISNWGIIIAHYFRRDKTGDPALTPPTEAPKPSV